MAKIKKSQINPKDELTTHYSCGTAVLDAKQQDQRHCKTHIEKKCHRKEQVGCSDCFAFVN